MSICLLSPLAKSVLPYTLDIVFTTYFSIVSTYNAYAAQVYLPTHQLFFSDEAGTFYRSTKTHVYHSNEDIIAVDGDQFSKNPSTPKNKKINLLSEWL